MTTEQLRQQIVIESASVATDSSGAGIKTWSTLVTVRAAKKHNTSREFYVSQKVNSEITDLFKIRYRTGLDTKMRVLYDSKYYNILGADDLDGRRQFIHLLCRVVS